VPESFKKTLYSFVITLDFNAFKHLDSPLALNSDFLTQYIPEVGEGGFLYGTSIFRLFD